jgi:glutamine synthetase type III
MNDDLFAYAKENGIKFFLISYSDITGFNRSKLVPTSAIGGMQKTGAAFAGFATYLDLTPADSDMFAKPDPSSVIQLPWNKEVAWVAADLYIDGEELDQGPRNTLKRTRDLLEQRGYSLKTGVECEFILLDPDLSGIGDKLDTAKKPGYDQEALMRNYKLISRIALYMESLGWGPYQNDHEDGNGQFEMNWGYADCLITADRHAFFKFMVRSVAEEEGLKATFMPKPFSHLTGNGCHIHFSLWDKQGINVFQDDAGELGLSLLAYDFLGGVMHNAQALTAFTNPTINSYKRMHAATSDSGATWSPNTVSYSGNNRTHMVRIPESDRFELRSPDGAANPYLLAASVAAAGLDGLANKRNPGRRNDSNSYEGGHDLLKLPGSLEESLLQLSHSEALKEFLGQSLIESYTKLKGQECTRYLQSVSAWEVEHYINL